MNTMTVKKAIKYAYPTSVTAKKLGYNNDGCWVVELLIGQRVLTCRPFTSAKAALQYADLIDNPYCDVSSFTPARHPHLFGEAA